MIYTASYFRPDCHHGMLASISLKTPMRVDSELEFFKPSWEMLKAWKNSSQDDIAWKQYSKMYWELMNSRRPLIEEWLEGLTFSDNMTLMCYEKTDQYCHRSLVGKIVSKYRPKLWGGENVSNQKSSVQLG